MQSREFSSGAPRGQRVWGGGECWRGLPGRVRETESLTLDYEQLQLLDTRLKVQPLR